MTFEDRVAAVARFGLTERQARFVATVMTYSGVCVPRQFATLVGTAYGQKVSRFFDRLVARKYAAECGCLHNRAALYHLRHQALYRAIGQPESRYRRPVSAREVIPRLMRLDAVITNRDLHWLSGEDEKVAFCSLMASSCPPERLPHTSAGSRFSAATKRFPDDLPIGVTSSGRVVFVVVLSMRDGDFRGWLQRHADLLRALPGWTLRLVLGRHAAGRASDFEAAARAELTSQLSPGALGELAWYCAERKTTPDTRQRSASDKRFARAHRAFATPRYQLLYRRWLTDGDSVLELVSSTGIADALQRGTGRIESQILPFSYRHLAPLVTRPSSSKGVEEGEHASARPQPPFAPSRALDESIANR